MKLKIPVIGGICKSTQGRDKDRYYIIREIYPDGSVGVVDGNFRKLAAPKKKNLKHVRLLPEKAEAISLKFIEGRQVFDTEVFSALKSYNYPQMEKPDEAQKNKL